MADDDAEWDLDRAYRHVVKLRGPQTALPELVTALHSGRLILTMTTRNPYDARVTWRGELAAHWFSGYLNLHLVEGAAKLVPARALVGFHESEFTVPARRVRQLWPKSPSAKTEAECWAWLEQIAKDHPDRQPKPKPELWKEAKQRWPKLFKRAFDRCWAKAVRAAPGWASHERRGRPRRNPTP
jgi:hypothetical protein